MDRPGYGGVVVKTERSQYLTDDERAALTTALIGLGFDAAAVAHIVLVAGRVPAVDPAGRRKK